MKWTLEKVSHYLKIAIDRFFEGKTAMDAVTGVVLIIAGIAFIIVGIGGLT